ncbi:hypothetical protein BHE74_00059410 [Ensete ventricosum]|nr:hypothetical protein GW17_00045742 [Ensete ventricosum]RWW35637.1 hypothetical protein BHE74_00059410 [Ensete ventricosum]RZR94096.1 hypothetical protein BHM03_00022716 [Ensete ventricosum]
MVDASANGGLQGAADCDRLQPRPHCKGAISRLQGAATSGRGRLRLTRKGLPPAGATAPAAGVAAPWQGGYRPQRAALPPAQGQRRRRRRVKERVRASF